MHTVPCSAIRVQHASKQQPPATSAHSALRTGLGVREAPAHTQGKGMCPSAAVPVSGQRLRLEDRTAGYHVQGTQPIEQHADT